MESSDSKGIDLKKLHDGNLNYSLNECRTLCSIPILLSCPSLSLELKKEKMTGVRLEQKKNKKEETEEGERRKNLLISDKMETNR